MTADTDDEDDIEVSAEVETFKGEIIKLSTRTWGEGWGYGTLEAGSREVNFSGTITDLTIGMCVVVTGTWEDTKYGARFKVRTLVPDLPASQDGVEEWLQHRLPQIGPIRAQDIAYVYGTGLWAVLENDPMQLMEINGITAERAKDIQTAYLQFKHEREAFIDFFAMGFTKDEARTALKKLGDDAHLLVRKNPYVLYLHHGFSFRRVDHLGSTTLGVPRLFGPRLVAGVVEAIRQEAYEYGDTIFTDDEVLASANALLDVQSDTHIRTALLQAISDLHVKRFGASYMLAAHYDAEALIAAKLMELMKGT